MGFIILCLSISLLIIFRIYFPDHNRSFSSALVLAAVALMIGFQNCAESSRSGFSSDNNRGEEVEEAACDPETDEDCNQVPPECLDDPDLPQCQDV